MGKATYKGLVPPDDPMFLGGTEIFSRPSLRTSKSVSVVNIPISTSGITESEEKLNLEAKIKEKKCKPKI